MVVCNIYRLFRNGTKFTKEGKKLERSDIFIPREYALLKNEKWNENGLWHEINEEKTIEFYELKEKKRLERIKNNKISGKLKEVMVDVISKGSDIAEIEVESEEVDGELKQLRNDYKKKYNKKAYYNWSSEQLKEKLK